MKTTNVYFIQAFSGGPIKIGKADDCKKRKSGHQVSNWQELRIVLLLKGCNTQLEKNIHIYLNEYRIRGEWFQENIFHSLGPLIKEIKRLAPEHRGKKEDEWMIWRPRKSDGKSDLAFKISLYSENKMRRFFGQKKAATVIEMAPPQRA